MYGIFLNIEFPALLLLGIQKYRRLQLKTTLFSGKTIIVMDKSYNILINIRWL